MVSPLVDRGVGSDLELVSKVAFVVGELEASGSGSRLEDPVGTFSRAGIRSREAPGLAHHQQWPGYKVSERARGRRRSGCRATAITPPLTAPDSQTGGRFENSERPATFETSSYSEANAGRRESSLPAMTASATAALVACPVTAETNSSPRRA